MLPYNAPLNNLEAFKKDIEDVISGREPESAVKNSQDVSSTSSDNFIKILNSKRKTSQCLLIITLVKPLTYLRGCLSKIVD